MISIRRTIIIAAAFVCGSAATAAAGGLFEPPARSMKDYRYPATAVPAPIPIPETVRWYLRGDVGYVNYDDPDIVEGFTYQLTKEAIDDTWSIGGGIGYYFTNHIRGDLTFEYFHEAAVTARNDSPASTDLAPGSREFNLKSWIGFANIYYDLWSRRGFTPYIGAGIGAVYHKTDSGTATRDSDGMTGEIGGSGEYDVAAALMAGFTYAFRDGVFLDAGYRYTYQGEAHMGRTTTPTGSLGSSTTTPTGGASVIDAIHAHEVRIGLRYDVW